MALSYTVTEGRNQKMTFTGTEDSLSVTWHQDYFVDIQGTALELQNVSAYDVLTAPGVPIVNRSIYFARGKIIPFVICRDKTAEQTAERIGRWKISTKWASSTKNNNKESDNNPQNPPAALTDLTPRVVPILGSKERQLYEDFDDKFYTTPTNNEWEQPLIEQVPLLTLQITQYEASITYEQMLARKFRLNSAAYRGGDPHTWFIQEVAANEVSVQLAGGPTVAAQVTYTLAYDEDTWLEKRPLFDTHYLQNGSLGDPTVEKLPFLDTLQNGKGYINADGTKRSSQSGAPNVEEYRAQRESDFSFLQV